MKEPIDKNYINFVGDVNSDMKQFLFPLVSNGIIKLTGKLTAIHGKYYESTFYIPEYIIYPQKRCKIIYLGNIFDFSWIYGREILFMMTKLLRLIPNNIILIYGEKEFKLLRLYEKYINRGLKFGFLKMWLEFPNVSVFENNVYYNCSRNDNFAYDCVKTMFENIKEIFEGNLGRMYMRFSIYNRPFIISHTVWKLLDLSDERIDNERLTKCRELKFLCINQIIGNIVNNERDINIKPRIINKKHVYLFNYNSSAAMNIKHKSYPCYVYCDGMLFHSKTL
jgi:hypothetical protein